MPHRPAPERAALPGVRVSGMGLSCALGFGVDVCLAQLKAGAVASRTWSITDLEEPASFPIYTFAGADSLVDLSSAVALIQRVVTEAVTEAGLTTAERAALPIFIGASAFSLDRESLDPVNVEKPSALGVQSVLAYQQVAFVAQQLLGASGDTFAFQTACTSSANAVVSAMRMIRQGEFPHALVLGVEIANLATMVGFSSLQLIAPALQPFDRDRKGIVLGEGVGAVVLSAARGNGAGLWLQEGGSNIDSYRVTTSNPDGMCVASLQTAVLARAGVAAHTIRGVKAHGTGSPMNDAGEAAVIRRAFDVPPPMCALKPYLGHTLGACGVNELVLMSAALRDGVFPATPGFRTPDPALGVVPTTSHGEAPDGHYLLNYFGFGGHNTILLLEKRS